MGVGVGVLTKINGKNFFDERTGKEGIKRSDSWDFPGGSAVKNPACSAGDAHSISGQGTKIPHATEQLSLCTTTRVHVQEIPRDTM